jgi:hypothetical protein
MLDGSPHQSKGAWWSPAGWTPSRAAGLDLPKPVTWADATVGGREMDQRSLQLPELLGGKVVRSELTWLLVPHVRPG